MPDSATLVKGSNKSEYLSIDQLQGGWSTRSFPHAIPDNCCAVLDNFMHLRDNFWTLRPGNANYGGGSGATGSGQKSLAGFRFYDGNPVTGVNKLFVQSNGHLYQGNDSTGAFTSRTTGMSTTQPATFAQMYDPDKTSGALLALFACDGSRIPQTWATGDANFVPVQTGAPFLPNGVVSGAPITPLYVTVWNYHLVYANEPTDPTALWISDALRPERFTGTSFTDSALIQYTPYYPAGRSGDLGVITGIRAFGSTLIIFFTTGIVTCVNTGSYGAFQYVFTRLSSTVGCASPQSIVAMDNAVIFFGGDRFYATDGQQIGSLPDQIPTVYGNDNISQQPPEISVVNTVVGSRRSLSYLASYQSQYSSGGQDRIVVFDTQANGGWNFGSSIGGTSTGGAWSRFPTGMPMSWGLECAGPGDESKRPYFWGQPGADLIGQFDPPGGAASDFGNPINFDIRTKSFFLDRPAYPKTLLGIYPIVVFVTASTTINFNFSPYAYFDPGTIFNFTADAYSIPASAVVLYGQKNYGTFNYQQAGSNYSLQIVKSYPQGGPITIPKGTSVAAGSSGSTTTAFNIIGFVLELIVDEPEQ